jgi:CheY-like chemotaxis protein
MRGSLASSSPQTDDVPAVLVVDDHPLNLVALEATLEPLGYRIVRANSGAEALKRLLGQDCRACSAALHVARPGSDVW